MGKQFFLKDDCIFCKKCNLQMDNIEYGSLCDKCYLFIGCCSKCESFSDNLIAWLVIKKDEEWMKNIPRHILSENFKFKNHPDLQLENFDIFKPPFKMVNNDLDDSTIWIFKCSNCNSIETSFCD